MSKQSPDKSMRLVRHSRAIVDSLSRGAQRLGSSTAQRLRSGRKSEIEPRPLSPRRTVQWLPPQRVERRGARPSSSDARKPLIPRWLAQAGYGSWAIIGVLIVISAVVFAIAQATPVFIAIFVALLLTAILNPLTNYLNRWVNRWIAVFAALFAFIGTFVALMTLVVSSIAGQWPNLLSEVSNGLGKLSDLVARLHLPFQIPLNDLSHLNETLIAQGKNFIASNWSGLLSETLANVSNAAVVASVLVLAFFITVFFLHSGGQMWDWFVSLLPYHRRKITNRAAQAGWSTFSGYARGTMLVAGTDGLFAGIFLQCIGVPVAPALGILVFIGAFIPLIGAPTAMILAMIVALAAKGIITAAIVGLGIALIGQIEGHILQPLIMGHQVSLHPVVVGVGVMVGTFTAGLLGAIIAIPIIAVAWAIFAELYTPRERS